MRLAFFNPEPGCPEKELSKQSIAYWKEKFRRTAVLNLPSEDEPSAVPHENSIEQFVIDKKLRDLLLKLSRKQGSSLFTTLLAVFEIMIYRYQGGEEVCIETADPDLPVDTNNTRVLRTELNGETSFADLLQRVQLSLAARRYGERFEEDANFVNKNGSLSENVQLREVFLFHSAKSGSDFKRIIPEMRVSKRFKVAFALTDLNDTLQGALYYRENNYDRQIIRKMIAHYTQLLRSIVKDPHQKIGALPMLTPDEEYHLLKEFNNTLTTYSKEKSLAVLFEEQVLKTPGNIALLQDGLTMSYLELNEQANKLANFLIEKGIKIGDNVGLLVSRSFSMITGMYAILKAGAAYVPVDPEYPLERQQYILNKSGVDLLLTDAAYPLGGTDSDFKVINFTAVDLSHYNVKNPDIQIDSRQLAYTIYTSGSTGLPKGVMIEHHSAVNLIEWVNREFNVGPGDRLLFITSMCFDLSVYDIFGMLSTGGSVVIARQDEVVDVIRLKDLLKRFSITFWDSVPTTMNYLVKELISEGKLYCQTDLRLVFMSGDWIPVQLPEEIKQYFPNAEVISLGGATEGTVWSNYFPVKEVQPQWPSIPYGKPIANNFFYVLNEQLQPVPQGIAGELYIGGIGVARGYAGDAEKTDYSFVKDPFNDSAGGRMYRTGDLGRMLPDGNLEFLGRKDSQVKIRGYRVELGEIESQLNQNKAVNQAVVLTQADNQGNKILVAYVVAKEAFDKKAVISYLKSKLPEYMVPALFVELPRFPLTSNGKIDKKALAGLEISANEEDDNYEKPYTENQKKLAAIWKEILGVQRVGINDNFFELGGHSLIAVRMITRLEAEIGVKLPLAILFKYPTIKSLISFIEKENSDVNTNWRSLVPIKASGTKMPIYIIHGSGLNVLSFSDIAMYVDEDQPVFGLQAKGLNGTEDTSDDMNDIAKSYIEEILEHNPLGPYAIAGYSFGGYVAVEMRKQLELMGKEVKMLAIFDTNAVDSDHYKLSTKIKRQFPKFLWFLRSLIDRPGPTLSYQQFLLRKKIKSILSRIMGTTRAEANDFYTRLEQINRKHWYAFRRYDLTPFNETVHLFRAKERIYFVDDFKYLGWSKFAKKGVKVYEVSGDHRTMLLPPHAKHFAHALQEALDNC